MALKFFSRLTVLILLTLISTSVSAADKGNAISASNEKLQYVGRIDFSDKKAPKLSWSGSAIRATFTGNSLSVILDDQKGNNYFDVYIDDKFDAPFKIDCDKGTKTYEVATGLEDKKHSLLIYRRTEGQDGTTLFKGLVLSKKGKLLDPPARPTRRIEFYGDSITAGYGCERTGRDGQVVDKNSFLAYSGVAARTLKAEAHIIAYSGIGLIHGWTSFPMTNLYDKVDGSDPNSAKWNFKSWTPDVVVINLFENDKSKNKNRTSQADYVKSYVSFIKSIQKNYPKVHIICAIGSMSAGNTKRWVDTIDQAVNEIKKSDEKAKIDTLKFSTAGVRGHPKTSQHKVMAASLVKLIESKVKWPIGSKSREEENVILGNVEVKHCKTQAKSLSGNGSIASNLRTLDRYALKKDEKGIEAKALAEAAREWVKAESTRLTTQAETSPGKTLLELPYLVKRLKGLPEADTLKTLQQKLSAEKHTKVLAKLLGDLQKINQKIAKKGSSKTNSLKLKSCKKKLIALAEQEGVPEVVAIEARSAGKIESKVKLPEVSDEVE